MVPTPPHPRVHGGGPLSSAAVDAALAAPPPLAALASLPRSVVADLGQSPAVFKPPTPPRYELVTGADGVASITM